MKTLQFPKTIKKGEMPFDLINAMSVNILEVLAQATPDEIAAGITWYANARADAFALAKKYALPLSVVASATAALSPSCSWARNKIDAEKVLEANKQGTGIDSFKVSTYNVNKRKAWAVVTQNKPELVNTQKTSSFADNIARANSEKITIDFHAASAALGVRYTAKTAKSLSANQYRLTSEAYALAAESAGLQGYELQAIVWVTWRRLIGVGAHHG